MYSDAELESAIASGKLTREAADALREHSAELRATPNADEEQFRLITSFNDIFVAIAGVLVLVAAGYLGARIAPWMGGVAVAAVAWGLAEFFTLKRRMAFPSIIFFIAFAYGVLFAVRLLLNPGFSDFGGGFESGVRSVVLYTAIAYAVTFAAIFAHWKRFMVPISVAAAAGSIAGIVFSLIVAAFPDVGQWTLYVVLVMGLAMFAYAMWWDMSDRARTTRRSDVAFWLHLLASPMIVHPIFWSLGFNILDVSGGADDANLGILAVIAIALYFAFGLIALIIDRRAFLVSALLYVLAAIVYLFSQTGIEGTGLALAALIIGSALLTLSAAWQLLRSKVVPLLPEHWQERLPALNRDRGVAMAGG